MTYLSKKIGLQLTCGAGNRVCRKEQAFCETPKSAAVGLTAW